MIEFCLYGAARRRMSYLEQNILQLIYSSSFWWSRCKLSRSHFTWSASRILNLQTFYRAPSLLSSIIHNLTYSSKNIFARKNMSIHREQRIIANNLQIAGSWMSILDCQICKQMCNLTSVKRNTSRFTLNRLYLFSVITMLAQTRRPATDVLMFCLRCCYGKYWQ